MTEPSKTPRTDALTNGIDRLANEHPEIVALCRELELSISEERSMRESCERGGELLAKDAQEYRRYAGELRRLLQLVRTHVGGGWLETAYPSLPQQIDAALAKHPTVPEIGQVPSECPCCGKGPVVPARFLHCLDCGSDFAGAEEMRANKAAVLDARSESAIGTMTASERRDALMEECDDWIAAYTPDFKTHQYDWTDLREAWFIGRASTVPSQGQTEKAVLLAVVAGPHCITDGTASFHYDPSKPGNNALDQLVKRVTGCHAQGQVKP